jgi:hypothetical protein
MHPRCRNAVQAAAGRKLTDAEIKKIDDRMAATMRQLARTDPAWQSKPAGQRVTEAAQVAMQEIQTEAQLKVQRAQAQILATSAMGNRVGDLMAAYATERSRALVKEMELTDNYAEGMKREIMSQLMPLMDAVNSREGASAGRGALMFLFNAENPKMTQDLAREIFNQADGATGNQMAQKAAKVWLEQIEQMRTRFNGAGGDVGKLDYGYLPQPHDQALVRGKGDVAARDRWVRDALPLLDRGRYLMEDGARMTDQQLAGVLNAAWETLATGGLNKLEPGKSGGSGAKANAGSESRVIHFKDADAYMTYMGSYGGGSMYDAMIGHIGGMTRDIALVERYGPNPATQMQLQFDLSAKADMRPVDDLPRSFGFRPQSYWDLVSGKTGMATNGNVARVAQDLRNVQVFGKLAGAVLSSVTDMATYFVSTGFNRLSYYDALKNIGKVAADSDTRAFLTMHGVIADSMISNLNRWAGDNIKNNWSGRLANSTMKLSLMNAWTDTMRRAFSLTMMGGLAKMSKTAWNALDAGDRTHLTRKGITEADWQVIRSGQLTDYEGGQFLTPEAIRAGGDPRANEVVAKVLGLITDESEYAVINPDLATKLAASAGGMQRGTLRGEMARSVMQFKSFPIAMVSRHWRRMLDMQAPDGGPAYANRLAYAGAMLASLTALGAVAFQTKQIVQGKDPIDMTTDKFWFRAMAQGGALSIVGDFLLTDPTANGGDAVSTGAKVLLGPTFGSAADLTLKLGVENFYQAKAGKDTHAGAEALRIGRSHLPYVNLWYAKAALDHMGLHALQENLSPGYLGKMQKRARKDWGQEYWWEPGSGAPDRAPDMTAVAGE